MSANIYLAYDGSINADWVSRYAIRMAANTPSRKIVLVHVLDGVYSRENIEAKIGAVEAECGLHSIVLERRILPLRQKVLPTLLGTIPAGDDILCVCGARVTSMGKGFIAGTISEQLLRRKRFNVMALRVVRPGLLGMPEELLFPLSGHPRGFNAAMSFLDLLAPYIRRLHLLRVMQVSSLWFKYLPVTRARELRGQGIKYVSTVLEEIRQQLDPAAIHLDAKVVLSDDWATEILIHASKLNAQLIIMGASDRNLPARYFYGNRIERILRDTPCDVGIYRKI